METSLSILTVDGKPMVSSLEIAKKFGKRHKNVLRDIDNLKRDGNPDFNGLNFEPVNYLDKKGETRKMFNLTKDGFMLLAMGLTGEKATALKIAFIDQFNLMERMLREHYLADTDKPALWNRTRFEGKQARRTLTDVIKEQLIPLAISQGSKNFDKLYAVYSKMFNNIVIDTPDFLIPKGETARNYLLVSDLGVVRKLEYLIADLISTEVERGTFYKEIFQICKRKLELIINSGFGKVLPMLPKHEVRRLS